MKHRIVPGMPEDEKFNTLVRGHDVLVPLEADLEDDPLQDDEVRLLAEDGDQTYSLRTSDAAVTFDKEKNLLLYQFRNVAFGLYDLQVRVDDEWVTMVSALHVLPDGVWVGDEQMGTDEPTAAPKREDEARDDDETEEFDEDEYDPILGA